MIAIHILALMLLGAAPNADARAAPAAQPPAWARATLAALPVTLRPATVPRLGSRMDVARFLSPLLREDFRSIPCRPGFVASWDPWFAGSAKFRRARTPDELDIISSLNASRLQDLTCEFAPELGRLGRDVTNDLQNINALMARAERIERLMGRVPVYLAVRPPGPDDHPPPRDPKKYHEPPEP